MIGLTRGVFILTYIFMLNDFYTKADVLLSLQFTGNNVTMAYAEIGASLNNSCFSLLWGVIFVGCFLSLVVLKIL